MQFKKSTTPSRFSFSCLSVVGWGVIFPSICDFPCIMSSCKLTISVVYLMGDVLCSMCAQHTWSNVSLSLLAADYL